MAGELQAQIERLKHKTQLLFDRYSLIVARKNEADAEIVELDRKSVV